MEAKFQHQVLSRHRDFLEDRMDVDSGLLDKLLANETLVGKNIRDIRKYQTFDERNSRLLDYILQKDKVDCLVASLIDTKQTHLVNYLDGDGEYKTEYGDDWPLGHEQISILNANQETLVDILDPDYLIGQMFSAGILNYRQQKSISSETNVFVKTQTLLEVVRRRSLRDYKKTIESLHATNQSHIAQILEKGGVVMRVHSHLNSEEDDETEEEIIARFANVLSGKSLETSSRILEGTLNVIAAKKGQSIVLYIYCKTLKDLIGLQEMNESGKLRAIIKTIFNQLLSHVSWTSVNVENLESFVKSLFNQLLYQSQIKQMTIYFDDDEYNKCRSYFPGSRFVRAVSDFNPSDMNVNETEELKKRLQRENWNETGDVSINYFTGQNETFDLSQLALYSEKGDHFELRDLVDIGDNVTWWKAKRLRDGQIGFIPRNRVVIDYDIQKKQKNEVPLSADLLEAADQLAKTQKTSCSAKTVDDLPLELLDIILRKTYLLCILCENLHPKQRDIVCKLLSMVDICWSHRINRRKFKKSVWRHLAVGFAKFGMRGAIYRNNREYFTQNIERHSLIKRLRHNDCITDYEGRIIGRQKDNQFKALAHLEAVLRRIDDERYQTFVLCLRQTDQKLVARVADNGGVVLKATILGDDLRRSESLKRAIVQSVNSLQDKHQRRSHQIEKLISQLKNDNIELLNATRDKNPALSLWCRSQAALEIMTSGEFCKRLLDILSFRIPDFQFFGAEGAHEIAKPSVINIDVDQLKKTPAFSLPAFIWTWILEVYEEYVIGVAKLSDRICVLCGSAEKPTAVIVLLVFEDRSPFGLQQRIDVQEVRRPWDMASSRMENCLYVTDLGSRCIWKIAGDDYKLTRWLSGISAPFTLSISGDGQLCLTRVGQPLSSLEIYRSDSHLCLHIILPEEINDPLHAVETSTGNFVILHRRGLLQTVKDSCGLTDRGPSGGNQMLGVFISEVTRDGRTVINCFDPAGESEPLNHPEHLAVDSDVFVADTRNGRVVQLNSNLTWNRTLLPMHPKNVSVGRINWPSRLHYDEHKKQLCSASRLNGCVIVYSLR